MNDLFEDHWETNYCRLDIRNYKIIKLHVHLYQTRIIFAMQNAWGCSKYDKEEKSGIERKRLIWNNITIIKADFPYKLLVMLKKASVSSLQSLDDITPTSSSDLNIKLLSLKYKIENSCLKSLLLWIFLQQSQHR